MLTQTIQAGRNAGAIDEGSAKRVAVDTTVMEKTIAYPTDGRLYERARDQLVTLAQEARVELRHVRRRMIWNSRADFVADGLGSSGSGYAA